MLAQQILSKGIVTPKLASDDDLRLRDPLDQTHSSRRPRASASRLDRQAAMLRTYLQLDWDDRAIRTANLGGLGLCRRAPREVWQENQSSPLDCEHIPDAQQLAQDGAWLTPLVGQSRAASERLAVADACGSSAPGPRWAAPNVL